MSRKVRILFSGGGTGGHIYPAVAIARAVLEKQPQAEILFVGAEGRMEMEKVPAEGFSIIGIPIAGFQRRKIWKNFSLPFLLWKSIRKSHDIIERFQPMVAVGTGGYASGPVLWAARQRKIPYVLQEQNSFPGITNRLLASKAAWICTGYPDMERYFPEKKIIFTGNPVRVDLKNVKTKKAEALHFFGLQEGFPVILILGGSLGSKAINEAIAHLLPELVRQKTQLIWQTGKIYYESARESILKIGIRANVFLADFIQRMDFAYAAADLVVSRAGASTVSEICLTGNASVLIPSPNVSEDHQTKNALALSERGAAIYLPEPELPRKLLPTLQSLLASEEKRMSISRNACLLAKPNAASEIADCVLSLIP